MNPNFVVRPFVGCEMPVHGGGRCGVGGRSPGLRETWMWNRALSPPCSGYLVAILTTLTSRLFFSSGGEKKGGSTAIYSGILRELGCIVSDAILQQRNTEKVPC